MFLLPQIKDCLDHTALPMDGATLIEALHQRGINVRYLGSVLEFVDKMSAKPQLDHFYVRYTALQSHVFLLLGIMPGPELDLFFLITENRDH